MMQKIMLIAMVVLFLAGCGRKGQLVPPEALLPAPVSDLRAAQQGELFRISWSVPAQTTGKKQLKDLAGFRLFKREVLPPGEDCEACPSAYRLLKNVDLEYLQDVRRSGSLLFVSDGDVATGTTYQYKVVSVNREGTFSSDSNKARRRKMVPPAAPRLQGKFAPTEALLHWEGGAPPPDGKVVGYNVYRWRGDALPALLPLNGTPVAETEFTDTRLDPGVIYVYAVRTVAEVGGETVESALSNEVRGTLTEPE